MIYHTNCFNNFGLDSIPMKEKARIKEGCILDCGAYMGDSLIFLYSLKSKKIFCLELENENLKKLEFTIKENKLKNVEILPYGLSDKKGTLKIKKGRGSRIVNKKRDYQIFLDSIDNLMKEKKVSLIKMDIERYELKAIKGAKNTIRINKPVLLISLYHTPEDFFEIPKIIKE